MKQGRVMVVVLWVLAVAVVQISGATAFGQASDARARMGELRDRFKDRLPAMQKLRAAGKVGETSVGTVEAVKGRLEKDEQKLMDAENADRAELYQIIARQQGTTAAKVARIDGTRRIKELPRGEYYKDEDGNWKQK